MSYRVSLMLWHSRDFLLPGIVLHAIGDHFGMMEMLPDDLELLPIKIPVILDETALVSLGFHETIRSSILLNMMPDSTSSCRQASIDPDHERVRADRAGNDAVIEHAPGSIVDSALVNPHLSPLAAFRARDEHVDLVLEMLAGIIINAIEQLVDRIGFFASHRRDIGIMLYKFIINP